MKTIFVCPTCGEWDKRAYTAGDPPRTTPLNESCGYGNHEPPVAVEMVALARLEAVKAERDHWIAKHDQTVPAAWEALVDAVERAESAEQRLREAVEALRRARRYVGTSHRKQIDKFLASLEAPALEGEDG